MSELYVVTGGGTGMGRDVALTLAQRGHDVVIVGRRSEPLKATADAAPRGRIETVSVDVGTVDGATALRTRVDGRRLAGIVTAAGGQGDFIVGDTDPADVRRRWADALDKNFYSALLPVESLIPDLIDGRGRIVLISSVAGLDGMGGPYATAKAALTGYGFDLARRLGTRGITANVVAPGFVADTDFFEAGGFGSVEPMIGIAAGHTLVGRAGSAADVSHIVLALLDEAAGWTTGQVISPNGGTLLVR